MKTANAGADDEVEVLGRRYRFKVAEGDRAALQQAAARLRDELVAIQGDRRRGDAIELLVLAALRLSLDTAADAGALNALDARLQALTAEVRAAQEV